MSLDNIAKVMQRIEAIRGQIKSLVGDAGEASGAAFATQLAAAENSGGTAANGLARAPEPYKSMLEGAARRNQVPFAMLESVARRESNFNPRAVSPKGAQGFMQLIPSTQQLLGVTDPFDAGQSIEGGARYLRMMLDRFGNDHTRALAAYNAGPGAVERHNGVPPFSETRSYVARILGDLSSYNTADEGADE